MKNSQERSSCAVCNRQTDWNICYSCAGLIRIRLLDAPEIDLKASIGYCLQCHELVGRDHLTVSSIEEKDHKTLSSKDHTTHKPKIIPFGCYKGEMVAWVKRSEAWSQAFNGIEGDMCFRPSIGHALRLFPPRRGLRCKVCDDLLFPDTLHGPFSAFCTVKCWLEGDDEKDWDSTRIARGLVAMDCTSGLDNFCVNCSRAVDKELGHKRHVCIPIMTDSGCRPRVQLDAEHHHLATMWRNIKGAYGIGNEPDILVKDNVSARCHCGIRLVDGIWCSWKCSLPPKELPRALQLGDMQQADKPQGADELRDADVDA